MTEEFETGDFEFSNENDILEEEVDKLNDLTFGDEITWRYNNLDLENDDSNFERFPFDEFDSKADGDLLTFKAENKNDSDNLLGLKGSFFNFGLFKSAQKGDDEPTLNNSRDADFEIAMDKLDLLDVEEEQTSSVTDASKTERGFGDFNIYPLNELIKYSEMLYLLFQGYQKSSNNTQILNSIAANHLHLLSTKLTELSLPINVLLQLRYFRMLTNFIDIDSRINDIRTKWAKDQLRYNAEMAILMHQFITQSPQQQSELAAIHPFYNNLLSYLCVQKNAPILTQVRQCSQRVSDEFDPDNGGWMSASEREWLMKMQTRNLVFDNPYVHDYYHTIRTFKEMSTERESQIRATGNTTIADPISLLPSPITGDQLGAGIDPTKDGVSPQYVPEQFANSLGTVTTSNLNTPRRIIEITSRTRRTLSTKNDSYETVRVQRELLGMIESVYSVLLRVDEVDKSLAKMLVVQHQSRPVLVQYRERIIQSAMATLTADRDILSRIMTVEKGAAMLVSVMAAVAPGQLIDLVLMLFRESGGVYQSDFFSVYESMLRSVIVGRVRALAKEHLSNLVVAFFKSYEIRSNNTHAQPLIGFCQREFGPHVVFTTLDAFLQQNPANRSTMTHLTKLTLDCCRHLSTLPKITQEYPLLFSSEFDQK